MTEEKKKESNTDTGGNKKSHKVRKRNNNIFIWIIIIVAVVGAVVFFKQRTPDGKERPVSDKVSQEVSTTTKKIIEENLVMPGTKVEIKNVTEESGLYKIDLVVEDQEITSYLTKDKMKFIPQLINTDDLKKEQQAEKTDAVAIGDTLKGAATELGIDEGAFSTCIDEGRYADKVENSVQEGTKAGIQGTPHNVLIAKGVQYEMSGALPLDQITKALDSLLAGGTPSIEKAKTNVKAVSAKDHIRGNKNAKVTFIEYSDLECPFCKKHHKTMEELTAKYADRVQFVFRQFPLDQLHPNARAKAEASECANELGGEKVFWKYLDMMFKS